MKKSAISIIVAALAAGTLELVPLPRDIESDWLNLKMIFKWRAEMNELEDAVI
tara:strand:- start:204 stop:362 length:159 start_codon:yes stop_codon:yes gene_type:complete